MKKILLIAAVGFLALDAGIASAADMAVPVVAKAPPVVAPTFDPWTGVYIGGNIGSAMVNTEIGGTTTGTRGVVPFSETFNATRSQHGPLGGGQIGINYEIMPRVVLGVEGDIDWSNLKGSVTPCSTKTAAGVIDCGSFADKIDEFGTARARLGYRWENFLLYGTGGFAWAHDNDTFTLTCDGTKCPKTSNKFAFNAASSSQTAYGWSAGGGMEWRVLPNWLLRVEYLHLQFNHVSNTFNLNGTATVAGVPTPVVATSTASLNTGVEVLRVGLSYMFNWGPAPLAQ
jgi:outer membrane immunogenic protein